MAATQVLLAVMKAETAARFAQMACDSDDNRDEDSDDGEELWQKIVNALFGKGLHPSSRLYPVFQAIREWTLKQCEGELVHLAQFAWEKSSGPLAVAAAKGPSFSKWLSSTRVPRRDAWEEQEKEEFHNLYC